MNPSTRDRLVGKCHVPPPPPTLNSLAINTTEKQDRELAREILRASQENQPCHPKSTPVAAALDPTTSGFGNIILFELARIHQAVLQGRVYVVTRSKIETWPLSLVEMFRASSCQHLWETNPRSFRDVTYLESTKVGALFLTKHPQFYHRPLLWWLQQLADYSFQPAQALHPLFRSRPMDTLASLELMYSYADQYHVSSPHTDMMNATRNDASEWAWHKLSRYLPHWETLQGSSRDVGKQVADLSILYPPVNKTAATTTRKIIGLHIRVGDSCGSVIVAKS